MFDSHIFISNRTCLFKKMFGSRVECSVRGKMFGSRVICSVRGLSVRFEGKMFGSSVKCPVRG